MALLKVFEKSKKPEISDREINTIYSISVICFDFYIFPINFL